MKSREGEIALRHRILFWTWERTYVGSGTVWRDAVTGRRAGSHLEEQLAGIAKLRRARSEASTVRRQDSPQANGEGAASSGGASSYARANAAASNRRRRRSRTSRNLSASSREEAAVSG